VDTKPAGEEKQLGCGPGRKQSEKDGGGGKGGRRGKLVGQNVFLKLSLEKKGVKSSKSKKGGEIAVVRHQGQGPRNNAGKEKKTERRGSSSGGRKTGKR